MGMDPITGGVGALIALIIFIITVVSIVNNKNHGFGGILLSNPFADFLCLLVTSLWLNCGRGSVR